MRYLEKVQSIYEGKLIFHILSIMIFCGTEITVLNWLSFSGLILDIIGATMVYVFGVNPNAQKLKGGIQSGMSFDDKKARVYSDRSTIGIMLLVIGFLLQLFGTLSINKVSVL